MKKCFKCDQQKPLEEFYRHKMMADGHLNKCKECTKADVRLHRIVSDRPREYDRERYRKPERYARASAVSAKWARENSKRKNASTIVSRALKAGKIVRPDTCEICGIEGRIHGHHEDYDKPLEVMWLCPKCHHGRHANAF